MLGKAHLLCSSLSNFAPDETKLPCLLLLQGYVVVGNPASAKSRKSQSQVEFVVARRILSSFRKRETVYACKISSCIRLYVATWQGYLAMNARS